MDTQKGSSKAINSLKANSNAADSISQEETNVRNGFQMLPL